MEMVRVAVVCHSCNFFVLGWSPWQRDRSVGAEGVRRVWEDRRAAQQCENSSNLPETYSVPIFFLGEDIKNLQYAPLLSQVVAEKHIDQNDSMTLNYGCLSNDFFLFDYGFVITSNPFDCIDFQYDEGLVDAANMAASISFHPLINFSSPALHGSGRSSHN
ncbi:hypothetical protein Syun_012895 [Stephania yunnanensis]|uniref:Uncharacterized protein n=1 Tax=Stephania yunnanensis TaxID=152371 RepID=A0AAP0K1B7_9MAGN